MPTNDFFLQAAKEADLILQQLKGVKPNMTPVQDPFKVPDRSKTKPPERGRPKGLPSPVTEYVRSLGGNYKTTQEVADELRISTQSLRKYAKDRLTQAPSFHAPFGKIRVALYTPEDIEALRKFLSDRRAVIPND